MRFLISKDEDINGVNEINRGPGREKWGN